MLLNSSEKARAIIFFDEDRLAGELLYSEFESMLDGYVPAKEWAGRRVHAAFVEINHNLAITALVFFLLDFDANGWVAASWNMPLRELARTAAAGPDIGAGPIALASAEQSPNPDFTAMLWNPTTEGRANHFAQLKMAVERNRLGICYLEEPVVAQTDIGLSAEAFEAMERRLSAVLSQQLSEQRTADIRKALHDALEEQARVPVLRDMAADHLERLRLVEEALAERDQKLAFTQQQLDSLREHNLRLQEQLEIQRGKTEGLREYYEHKLQTLRDHARALAEQPLRVAEIEIEARVQETTQEFADLLQRKEVEVLYLNERLQQTAQQLSEAQSQTTGAAGALIDELIAAGVNFVTYQFGAAPLVLAPEELEPFLREPGAFVAHRFGVTENQYGAWLEHYQMPLCVASDAAGEVCSRAIERVCAPLDFVSGVSDCCPIHRDKGHS